MFRSLLLWFRRLGGVVLVSVGVLVGVVGLSGSAVLGWLWVSGQATTENDTRAAGLCAVAALLGAGTLWVGVRLWPGPRSDSSPGAGRPTPASQRPRHPAWFAGGYIALAAMVFWVWAASMPFSSRVGFSLLGVGLVFLGMHVVLAVHELGHLVAGALLGRDLLHYQIGAGPRLFGTGWRDEDFTLEWRLWPSVGLVQAVDGHTAGWRWRTWCFVAAGPLAHAALLAALVFLFLLRGGGLPAWGEVSVGTGVRLAGAFLLLPGGTLLLGALLSEPISVNGRMHGSDGHLLRRVPRMDAGAVETSVIIHRLARVERLWATGRWTAARTRLAEVLACFPGRPVLAVAEAHYLMRAGEPLAAAENLAAGAAEGRVEGWAFPVRLHLAMDEAHARVRAGQPERARTLCAEFLAGVTEPAERAEALDVFACVATHHGHRALLAEAETWSAEMLALEPEVPTRQATRGAVLVDLGRMEEAAALLGPVWERSSREVDAATAAFGLARVARSQGDKTGLRRWRRRALRFAPYASPGMAARIVGELTDVADADPQRTSRFRAI